MSIQIACKIMQDFTVCIKKHIFIFNSTFI